MPSTDETGWNFELRFMGQVGVHPDRSYMIYRSDDMIGDGGCVIVSRMGSDAKTEVQYSELSRLALHNIKVEGAAVVKVRRTLGGNIVGEWLHVPTKAAETRPASTAPAPAAQGSATTGTSPSGLTSAKDVVGSDTKVKPPDSTKPRPREPALRIEQTFGNRGVAFADFKSSSAYAQAQALVVQSDGHVLVVGSVSDEDAPDKRNFGLVRFDKNGQRDCTFGNDGYKLMDVGGGDNLARAAAVQRDGKIIVAGETLDQGRGTYDFALVRLEASGQLDSSFGGGVVATDFLQRKDDGAHAVVVQADGKIVAAGYSTYRLARDSEVKGTPESECFALARYHVDGSLDEVFGSGGTVMTVTGPEAGLRTKARALQLQADGRILAAGFMRTNEHSSASRLAISRHQTDGQIDDTFGVRGLRSSNVGAEDEGAYALALQKDGKIILAGAAARDAGSEQHFLIARLEPNGELDETFNGTGAIINREFVGLARGVVVLPDGRIVAAGSAAVSGREQIALVCYHQDGSKDETFGTGGVLFIDLGGNDSASCIVLGGDRIFVAGTSRVGEKSEFAVICLTGVASARR